MPKRIQRSRAKGWRMPEGAVYVGRPSKWGNFSRVYSPPEAPYAVGQYRRWLAGEPVGARMPPTSEFLESIAELRGKDLCCWCRLDQPCHADVLLDLANPGPGDAEAQEGTAENG